jgi:RNA polymerase sigma factor (sigma-70 family)
MTNHQSNCDCDRCLLGQMRSPDVAQRQRGWEAWYQRDAPSLHRYLERLCWEKHCPEYTDDLLHDTFLIGFKGVARGGYDEQKAPLRAYLYGIAKNRVHEIVRLQQREPLIPNDPDQEGGATVDLNDLLFLEEVYCQIQAALDYLPAVQQQVIVELYVNGKSSHKVAEALGLSAGNLRIIAHRAVSQIGKCLTYQYHIHVPANAIRMCLERL